MSSTSSESKKGPSYADALELYDVVLDKNRPGARIVTAIGIYAREQVYPFIAGSQTFEAMDKSLEFFKAHLRHSTNAATENGKHPGGAAAFYSHFILATAEDQLLDRELYPKLFASAATAPKVIVFRGLSEFPGLISETLKYYHQENRPAERITHGMEQIAEQNLNGFVVGVRSAKEYRERLSLLSEQLSTETDKFNARESFNPTVRGDYQCQWRDYVVAQIRRVYFTALFDKVYRSTLD